MVLGFRVQEVVKKNVSYFESTTILYNLGLTKLQATTQDSQM
jgi:hypothetical protein